MLYPGHGTSRRMWGNEAGQRAAWARGDVSTGAKVLSASCASVLCISSWPSLLVFRVANNVWMDHTALYKQENFFFFLTQKQMDFQMCWNVLYLHCIPPTERDSCVWMGMHRTNSPTGGRREPGQRTGPREQGYYHLRQDLSGPRHQMAVACKQIHEVSQ